MRRVQLTFWALVAVAVGATGVLSRAVVARPSPAAGIALAVSATLLAGAAGLALRILVVLARRQR